MWKILFLGWFALSAILCAPFIVGYFISEWEERKLSKRYRG